MVSLLPLRPLPPHLQAASKKASASKAQSSTSTPASADAISADVDSKPKAGKKGRAAAAASQAAAKDEVVVQQGSTQGADGTPEASSTQVVHEEGEECSTSEPGTGEYLVLLTRRGGIKRTPLTPQFYKLNKKGAIVCKVRYVFAMICCCRGLDATYPMLPVGIVEGNKLLADPAVCHLAGLMATS
jgi:hypothetical protein